MVSHGGVHGQVRLVYVELTTQPDHLRFKHQHPMPTDDNQVINQTVIISQIR